MTLLIILVFSPFLKVAIPPFFTATLMLHVPLFLSYLISPTVSALVGVISAIGFMMTPLGPIVAFRALMHGVIGYMGGTMVKKGVKYPIALAATLPVHAVLEAIVVILATGLTAAAVSKAITVVAIGTAIHHSIDSVIAIVFSMLLGKQLSSYINIKKAA
jgi:niacin transporter